MLGASFAALSNALALVARQRETLIGAVTFVLLPLTFLSGAFMQLSLAPGWIADVAQVQPGQLGRARGARGGVAGHRLDARR